MRLVMVQNKEIVHVTQVIMLLETVFYELVKLVQVNIGEQLTGQVTNWYAARP